MIANCRGASESKLINMLSMEFEEFSGWAADDR